MGIGITVCPIAAPAILEAPIAEFFINCLKEILPTSARQISGPKVTAAVTVPLITVLPLILFKPILEPILDLAKFELLILLAKVSLTL